MLSHSWHVDNVAHYVQPVKLQSWHKLEVLFNKYPFAISQTEQADNEIHVTQYDSAHY
jgi:hypothetical protein